MCRHPARDAIDVELVGDTPRTGVASRYGLTEASVRRHANAHLPERLVQAGAATDRATARELLAHRDERERYRDQLAGLLLGELALPSARLIAARLAEQAEVDERVREAEGRLHVALTELDACNLPDDPHDPRTEEERQALADERDAARQRVTDAHLVAAVYRAARIPVRDLLAVLGGAVADHLALEVTPAAGAVPPVIVFGAPLPDETPPPLLHADQLGQWQLDPPT